MSSDNRFTQGTFRNLIFLLFGNRLEEKTRCFTKKSVNFLLYNEK